MSKTTLVIGATGNVGHDVVRRLAETGQAVRAATRHPATYPYQHALVEPIFFDYDQPETYTTAVAGINNLFVIAKSADPIPQQTLIPLLNAAQAAGATHVVLMTALGVDQNPELGLTQVEQHLIQSGMAYTISYKLRVFTSSQGQNRQAKSTYGRPHPGINVWATKQRRVNPPFKPKPISYKLRV